MKKSNLNLLKNGWERIKNQDGKLEKVNQYENLNLELLMIFLVKVHLSGFKSG